MLLGVSASYHFWLDDDAGAGLCGVEDLPPHDRHPVGEAQLNRALLCKRVGQLGFQRGLLDPQCVAGDCRSEVMVLHICVFSARAHGGRVGEVDCAAVVLEERALDRWDGAANIEPLFPHLLDEQHEWLDLSGSLAESDVLTFSAAESDLGLELRLPQDGAAEAGHDVPRSGPRRVGFLLGSSGIQLPLKSASAHTFKESSVGRMQTPLSRVTRKCRPSHFTASPCSFLGSKLNLAHWCVAYAMSGREHFSR